MIRNQRLAAIGRESVRTSKSLSGVAAAIGGGILPFIGYLLGWLPSTGLLGMVVLAAVIFFVLLLTWNLSRYAEDRYWYDRKYKLISARWRYSPNPDLKTLHGECTGEREIVCLTGTLAYLTISVSPAENLVPFRSGVDYQLQLDPQSRRPSGGSIQMREPHRQDGPAFSFRVDFSPPLLEGEEAYVKFHFVLPEFKIASLDYLREKCKTAKLDARDYEFGSWTINFPTDRFLWDVSFSAECQIQPREVETFRGTSAFYDEQIFLLKSRSFTCGQEEGGGWRLKLDRCRPPITTRYRISWRPPSTRALAAGLGLRPPAHVLEP